MQESYYLENIDQIKAIAEPTRWRMLNLLISEQMTGAQLARRLKIPRPRAHYHLKTLEKVGLVEFQGEHTRNGMVERYFRAIAKQFLTDRLISRGRELPVHNEQAKQTGAAISEIVRAMLELASADVNQPDSLSALLHLGWNYQEDVYINREELETFKNDLRTLVRRLVALDQRDRLASAAEDLFHLRFTCLLTPASAFDFSPVHQDIAHVQPAAAD